MRPVTSTHGDTIDLGSHEWGYEQGLADLGSQVSDGPHDEGVLGTVTSLDDLIQGTPEDDILMGGLGDDTVQSFGGADHVDAGPGDDFVIADGSTGQVLAGSGDDYVYVAGGAATISLGSGADSLEFVAFGEGMPFGVHRVLDYDVFEDGPLNITAYLDAMDPGNVPNLDSNGDGVIDAADRGVAVVDGTMFIDLAIAWYHDLPIGSSVIALDGVSSLPLDVIG